MKRERPRAPGELGGIVADVFGGRAGDPGDGPDVAALEEAFDGARLWGMELDPKFRVLAVTLEPTAERYAWGETDDRRVQLLCFPVSTILASLRRPTDDATEVLAFEESQLVDVVAAMDGPTVSAPLFGLPEPRPGQWGPCYSMEGRSSAPDGVQRTLLVSAAAEDLQLDVFARFDELEVKDAAGRDLGLPG